MADFSRNAFMWIFVVLAGAILIVQIISSVIIYTNVSKIPREIKKDMDKVDRLVMELGTKLNQLENLNNRVSNIETNIIRLSTKYPPNQTININNMNQNELNQAINRAISLKFETISDKVEFNFIFNIVIGSLIGISFIYYFIFRRKK